MLGDVMNALFGAVLVDSNYDLEGVRAFFTRTILPFMDTYCVGPGEASPHPRNIWCELVSKRGCQKWEIRREYMSAGAHGVIGAHRLRMTIARPRAHAQWSSMIRSSGEARPKRRRLPLERPVKKR